MDVDVTLATVFIESYPDDAARVFERFEPGAVAGLLAGLRPEVAAVGLARSTIGFAATCLSRMDSGTAARILEEIDLGVGARLLRAVTDDDRARILLAVSEGTRTALERSLRYPEDTAGSVMEPRVLALPEDTSRVEAVRRLEREAHHLRDYVYVVDRAGTLVGVVGVRELLLADAEGALRTILHPADAVISPFAGVHELLFHPGWEDFHALPVVDEAGVLLGAIRYSTYRRLERERRGRGRAQQLAGTGVALAELYWLVLARALAGGTSQPSGPPTQGGRS